MIFSLDRTAIGGHRGCPALYPDNSLEGIRAARLVADFVEVDVRRTRDGELVLAHDPSVAGLTIAETLFSQLSGAVAHLGDGLVVAGPLPLNLEVKGIPPDPSDHGLALDVARVSRAGDLLTSFWWPWMDAVRIRYPEVMTGLLTDVDADGAIEHAVSAGHRAVSVEWHLITTERIERAHDAGVAMVAWTVNEPGSIKSLAESGVDAIITDDPWAARAELRGGYL